MGLSISTPGLQTLKTKQPSNTRRKKSNDQLNQEKRRAAGILWVKLETFNDSGARNNHENARRNRYGAEYRNDDVGERLHACLSLSCS
jgi:hypothetical protein